MNLTSKRFVFGRFVTLLLAYFSTCTFYHLLDIESDI